MNKIKLYTEEQLQESYNRGLMDGRLNNIDYSITDGFAPVELPTDADIHKQATNHSNLYDEFRAGATWVLNRIYGSIK